MIIDKDFLTENDKQKVYTLCSSPEVPWYFIKTTTTYNEERNNVLSDERTKENFQFIHTLRGDETIFSSYYDYIHNEVFLKFLNKHKIKCKSILRAKLNFVSSINQNEDVYQSPHVDYRFPHKVFLYYVNDSDGNTFITLSRREVTWEIIKEFHDGDLKYNEQDKLRNYIYINSEERKHEEKTVSGDDYSIINCCGDFQLAPKHIWDEIRGFEECLIYPLFADTNVQKKSVMHGFGLKAIYNPPMFHINHGSKGWGGGGIADGINKKANDQYRAVIYQNKTENLDTWGFSNVDIEFEIF